MTSARTRRSALAAAVSVTALVIVSACGGGSPRELTGFEREPRPAVDQVALPDLSRGGEEFEMRARPDGLLVVFFGFTNCPDFCPTTLADLRAGLRQLAPDDAARVDFAMVSVDPDRDIPVLTDYAQTFVDDAHALATTDSQVLRAAADPFGVSWLIETDDDGQVEVGHTTQMYVVDPAGELVLTWPFGVPADELAQDLEQLLVRSSS